MREIRPDVFDKIYSIAEYIFKNNVEVPRANVILATNIPEDVCKKVNLGYIDYRTIDLKDWENREDEGILFFPKAGEILHRVKKKSE